jgi:hypothetical protein
MLGIVTLIAKTCPSRRMAREWSGFRLRCPVGVGAVAFKALVMEVFRDLSFHGRVSACRMSLLRHSQRHPQPQMDILCSCCRYCMYIQQDKATSSAT